MKKEPIYTNFICTECGKQCNARHVATPSGKTASISECCNALFRYRRDGEILDGEMLVIPICSICEKEVESSWDELSKCCNAKIKFKEIINKTKSDLEIEFEKWLKLRLKKLNSTLMPYEIYDQADKIIYLQQKEIERLRNVSIW